MPALSEWMFYWGEADKKHTCVNILFGVSDGEK